MENDNNEKFELSVDEIKKNTISYNYFVSNAIIKEKQDSINQIKAEKLRITELKAKKEKLRIQKIENQKKITTRRKLMINKYGPVYGKIIANNKVQIGMNKEMCKDSWGIPNSVNKTINAYGTSEQWVYGSGNYLYFDNDILTSIQN